MIKHRGIPSRLSGTEHHFLIRRAASKPTPIKARPRYADRRPADRKADEAFLAALWAQFGEEPFVRGNLDAGRLNWLFGREVIAAEKPFDPASYDAMLRIDARVARSTFSKVFAAEAGVDDLDDDLDDDFHVDGAGADEDEDW